MNLPTRSEIDEALRKFALADITDPDIEAFVKLVSTNPGLRVGIDQLISNTGKRGVTGTVFAAAVFGLVVASHVAEDRAKLAWGGRKQ